MSYLVARASGATDWFFGTRIGFDAHGARAIEYHHIHPQATLRKRYSKSEINDLANLAFISSRANKVISARSPASYFPDVGEQELSRHFVPLDESLRSADAYPEFARARRQLLATAMTTFLEQFRPAFLDVDHSVQAPANRLTVNVYGDANVGDRDRDVEFIAVQGESVWTGRSTLHSLRSFLSDIENGLSAGLEINGEVVAVEGGEDVIEVPIGPFTVSGRSDEWAAMLERELDQPVDVPIGAEAIESQPWTGERVPMAVAEAE